MQITITVVDGKVKRSLRVLGTAVPGVINKNIDSTMQAAAKKVRHYPPMRSNQKYVRTGTFGRSVQVKETKRGGRGTGTYSRRATLVSDAIQKGRHYSVFVTGNAYGMRQANIHKARWAVAAAEVTKASRDLVTHISRDIGRALEKAGRG